ncbi:MAG TPA: Mu transposase C-terminal domain-containing protein [Thermoanaerobaculia bacterium]|nr:Mu transposase C-terminal domain-containing protein [Thermoanaerobaculia bacterium]
MTALLIDARPEPQVTGDRVALFLPLAEVAATLGVATTTVRRMVWNGTVESRETPNGGEVNVATLPPKYSATFAPQLAPRLTLVSGNAEPFSPRYGAAPIAVRRRADLRYEAVQSFRDARAARGAAETLAQAERRWIHNFRRSHEGLKVSIRSVKAWDQLLRDSGGNIDALVDRNDGEKQRGSRIPKWAKQAFKDEYLRAHKPNLRLIYEKVEIYGKVRDLGPVPSYHTFRRYALSIPKLVRKLLRDNADNPRAVLPHVRRDPTTLSAYHTIQADHREIDVPVRCDTGCDTCTGAERGKRGRKKARGHFPIWTVFFDIRSRRILGSEIWIDAPNSDRILSVFRRICEENGLPWRLYLDNGSDFRKAFGKRLRRDGKTRWDGPSEAELRGRFISMGIEVIYALPYNAQAKPIERMLRTFRHRFDEDFDAYRGAFGNKSELARELYYQPKNLPTVSELAFLLQLQIEEYNATPHTGAGMDERTPDDVFYDPKIRTPRRDPDASFGFLFFDVVKGGRFVGNNGIKYEGRTYRLTSLSKHLSYWGERVDMRVNPDDQTHAMVFDRRTGAFVCEARVDVQDATYSTSDDVTRHLIGRVFRDGRDLLRMAKANVEGAAERLIEYRAAKLEYLTRRVVGHRESRIAKAAALAADGGTSVTVIGPLSAYSHDRAATAVDTDATQEEIVSVLDEDAAAEAAALCVPAGPKRVKGPSAYRRYDGLKFADIAARLDIGVASLTRYRAGLAPWPAGMKERFDDYLRQRATVTSVVEAARPKQVTKLNPDLSYRKIAAHLGVSLAQLGRYRAAVCPWPAGMKERYDMLQAQRMVAGPRCD